MCGRIGGGVAEVVAPAGGLPRGDAGSEKFAVRDDVRHGIASVHTSYGSCAMQRVTYGEDRKGVGEVESFNGAGVVRRCLHDIPCVRHRRDDETPVEHATERAKVDDCERDDTHDALASSEDHAKRKQ